MDRASRFAWNFLGILLLIATALGLLLLVALTATLVRDAAHQPVSFVHYFGLLTRYVTADRLTAAESEAVVAISQPLILTLSIFALVVPVILLLKDRIENRGAVVSCFTGSRSKNRHRTARELAKQFAAADEICIVSGDFSWFTEDGEAGLDALKAIVGRANKDRHHLNIISYKTTADVETALRSIDASLRNQFLGILQTAPHLKGVKITLVDCQGYRKLYLISGAMDGHSEQMVIVNDRDYGRKLINTFHGLVTT